jgi:hypothetical protein
LTAVPAVVAPGGTVQVQAIASSTDGFPINYVWSVPTGWTAPAGSNGNSVVVTALYLHHRAKPDRELLRIFRGDMELRET